MGQNSDDQISLNELEPIFKYIYMPKNWRRKEKKLIYSDASEIRRKNILGLRKPTNTNTKYIGKLFFL